MRTHTLASILRYTQREREERKNNSLTYSRHWSAAAAAVSVCTLCLSFFSLSFLLYFRHLCVCRTQTDKRVARGITRSRWTLQIGGLAYKRAGARHLSVRRTTNCFARARSTATTTTLVTRPRPRRDGAETMQLDGARARNVKPAKKARLYDGANKTWPLAPQSDNETRAERAAR